jgi:transglutaminase-like putative cysteine protease
MSVLSVKHTTTYRYVNPVQLGEHRLMCRPRDSHDLRLLDTRLTLSPAGSVRWLHDVFGNSIAIVTFQARATELIIESAFRAQHFPSEPEEVVVEPYARHYPFRYDTHELQDLFPTLQRHYPDPGRDVDAWAQSFVRGRNPVSTLELLTAMTTAIRAQFSYQRREDTGTQTPLETLQLGSGSCRDFTLLLMEAARSLGFAARFVSGYLYDEKLVDAPGRLVGAGSTHAWVQIYLPGAGWVELDPTNALIGGRNLIRVAVARDASQAVPLTGTFTGRSDDFVGMSVAVEVTVS